MTGHDHRGELTKLEHEVRSGDKSSYQAGRDLLERVSADVPDERLREHLSELRAHASDGVGVAIVEQALSDRYPEHPTPS